jgi:hypothetical protein
MAKIVLRNSKIKNGSRCIFNSLISYLWKFLTPAQGTTITNFRVVYTGDPVTIDWGDGQKQVLTSNVNYNHTY